MEKWMRRGFLCALMLACMLVPKTMAAAKENDVIKEGIFVGEVDLSGMSAREAEEAVEAYVDTLSDVEITLLAA